MILTVTLNPSIDVWLRVPQLRVGAFHRAEAITQSAGGKGVNVSRVVRVLGGAARSLAPDGLAPRMNYKILSATPRTTTEVNAPGSPITRAQLRRLERRLLAAARRAQCVVLAGSLPPGAPANTYARWIAALRRRGVPVALDASGAALRQGLRARPWLIKPNREEAEALLGQRIVSLKDAAAAARTLLRRGAQVALLSLGRQGAVLALAASPGIRHAAAPRTPAGSVVGAGDALLGGFLVGWFRTASPSAALRWGAACGAAWAMTQPGTRCRAAHVRELTPRIRLRRLA